MLSLLHIFAIWHRRMQVRCALGQIDARSLRDAGIDPGLADYEMARPFWQPAVLLRDPAPALTAAEVANDDAQVHASLRLRAVAANRK